MNGGVVWHGTQEESFRLLQALNRHCGCLLDRQGVRTFTCASHRLLTEQRALNGLLFARRIAARLWYEETLPSIPDAVVDLAQVGSAARPRSL